MPKKKKLLFVNESLTLAGGERSLVTLLSQIDPTKYEVDLQLITYGGELEELVPPYVTILPELSYPTFARSSWVNNMFLSVKKGKFKYLLSKLKFSLLLRRKNYNHPQIARLYWETASRCYEIHTKNYDVAIAYAQGVPTYYVADKVVALKKIAWVNVGLKMDSQLKIYLIKHYSKFNYIVPVSDVTLADLQNKLPEFKKKMVVVRDMINYDFIRFMSEKEASKLDRNSFTILTVARLNKMQKGYDISLNACKILKEKNIHFRWYAIGDGPYKDEMLQFIQNNKLEDYFILLGTTPNPYPYFLEANLYVQTSRHEGYGLSIAEARLLNTPVVTTNYDTVYMQMKHENNGLITEMDPDSVATAIIRMIEDKTLYQNVKDYLKNEQKEDFEPLQKFYELID